ncbi:MAG: N-formylglutamate deformylase [Gammaproteobacteria bacterium]|nr:N-formylglutamate deformylase [Gammaproteobacteria bacterium]
MDTFEFTDGTTPLLVSMPHDGTAIPLDLADCMTAYARTAPDTDWHMTRLYDFAGELGVSILRPFYSRFVIDLNRPPDGEPLYPGADNTELCPTRCFDETAIYRVGEAPGASEIGARRDRYWQPYHDRIASTLAALKARHGIALLFDAHSILSVVPRFFEGKLPDLNLGTASGTSCDPSLQAALTTVLESASDYTHVVNGRFSGGYITRTYGDPGNKVHAVQLEQAQCSYMDENPPYDYREDLADGVRPTLRRLLETMLEWSASQT